MLDEAIARLKQTYATVDRDAPLKRIVDARDEVLTRYGTIFSREAFPSLTSADFQGFLMSKNNRHWSGLHRQGPRICKNMDALRAALRGLHDNSRPIEDRFDTALNDVGHLGKGILSSVLHVMGPNDYGVWNRTSEGGLKILGVWPDHGYGASPGKRYKAINATLHELSAGVGVDLWTLDALLWRLVPQAADPAPALDDDADVEPAVEEGSDLQKFALERYLHEFLRDNWNATELGRNWRIYADAGDDDAGYKYQCGSIGQIDILARHTNGRDWLVVELKRDQTGDATIGQISRYMGFVRHKLAKETEQVFGLVIAGATDDKLHYAASNVPNVAVHTYEVNFKLGLPRTNDLKLPFELPTLNDIAKGS